MRQNRAQCFVSHRNPKNHRKPEKVKALDYIRVVLVEPTHPGNIGATARAMANMGVSQLMLINPKVFPSPVADARAAGADNILDNAQVFDNLDQAIADCTLVFGTTARLRAIEWQSLEPREAMEKAAVHAAHQVEHRGEHQGEHRVAILFGNESRGLTNDQLERCHHLVRIPVADEFASLNLASAVMVMLYELRRSLLGHAPGQASGHIVAAQENISPTPTNEPIATAADMQNFHLHLQQVLQRIEFIDGRSTKLQRKLVRLFNRAHPYEQEIKMLRGVLTAIESKIAKPEHGESDSCKPDTLDK